MLLLQNVQRGDYRPLRGRRSRPMRGRCVTRRYFDFGNFAISLSNDFSSRLTCCRIAFDSTRPLTAWRKRRSFERACLPSPSRRQTACATPSCKSCSTFPQQSRPLLLVESPDAATKLAPLAAKRRLAQPGPRNGQLKPEILGGLVVASIEHVAISFALVERDPLVFDRSFTNSSTSTARSSGT